MGKQLQLTNSVSWASTRPQRALDEALQEVTLRHDYFPCIEDVYKKLRPSPEPAESLFVGYVDTLNGNPGSDGQVQGETRFVLVDEEEEVIRARSDLGPKDYQKAVEAHRAAQIVIFKGKLHLGRRVHRITDVQQFEILNPMVTPGP